MMMKCIAHLTAPLAALVASTVNPHAAETCPVFPAHDTFVCRVTRGPAKPPYYLQLKPGTVDGKPAYKVITQLGSFDLVPGRILEQTENNQVVVTSTSCKKHKASNGEMLDAILYQESTKAGQMTSQTLFYPQGGGIVRLSFGPGAENGGFRSSDSCTQYRAPKPAPTPAAKPKTP